MPCPAPPNVLEGDCFLVHETCASGDLPRYMKKKISEAKPIHPQG